MFNFQQRLKLVNSDIGVNLKQYLLIASNGFQGFFINDTAEALVNYILP